MKFRIYALEELLNLGKSLREYVRVFGEPFIDDKGAKIFEWENNEKVRFRVIADVITERHIKDITQNYQKGGPQLPLSPFDNQIITFYSDRNLNQKMIFKNPKVEKYFSNQEQKVLENQESKKLNTINLNKKKGARR